MVFCTSAKEARGFLVFEDAKPYCPPYNAPMRIGEFSDIVFRLTNSAIEARPGEHQRAQIEILRDAIKFDAAWWGWSNLSGGRNRLINTGTLGLPQSFESAVRAVLHLDPLVKHGRNLAVFGRTVDVENDDLPEDYKHCLEAFQIGSILNGHCRLQGETQFNFFLSLYTRSGGQKLSNDDTRDFRLILRHIEQNLSLSLRAELRSLAPENGEAAFVSVGGAIVRSTRGFLNQLEQNGLNRSQISEILADLSFGQRRWRGDKLLLDARAYRRDLILVRLAPHDVLAQLSKEERNVADLLALGHTMREIAQKREVSHNTVRNQVASIYRKTGVKNRTMLLSQTRLGQK
ncbi:LuxR C-terminal-related transcriptional regulator [Lentibacter algarum]|uniref:helix-turn-helix transcriptional regulator n=1 Tax=Lentibacter algarum TaxID=576131 RepID=UPI001C06C68D|nr:LuxR C-terminal-related transcriptional regulator [Lentibacter algarum]MBU2981844.1 LuxR C-terminal-related transcriptional regulator [Lentibacter algarum]